MGKVDPISKKSILSFLLISLIAFEKVKCQSDDNEPSLPSNLPSPPEPMKAGGAGISTSGQNSGGSGGQGHGTPGSGGAAGASSLFTRIPPIPPISPEPDEPPPPTILVLVPQFKLKIQNLPKWFGSNVKYSFPISIFFDKLDIQPGFFNLATFFGHGRRKRNVGSNVNKRNKTVSQRGIMLAKIEEKLRPLGIGRNCILRAICEIHEHPLQLGLLGEIIHLLFTISNYDSEVESMKEFLDAEITGKTQGCDEYHKICDKSIFI